MDFSIISKKFTNETIKEIARNANFEEENIKAELVDTDSKKGDSYLSEIYHLKISNDKKYKRFFIKTIPKSITRCQAFRLPTFHYKEIYFFTKIVPALNEFQKSTGTKDFFDEYPKCFASFCDGENDFLVLEDVIVDGYVAPERQNYTDTETCSLILKVLGRFHGVSIAFKNQKPEEFTKLIDGCYENYYKEELREYYGGFLNLAIKVAIDAVEKTYPNSIYLQKTKSFLNDKLFDDMINMIKDKTKFSVIGHGDCWRPNFLVKYNKANKPDKAKIIDFQLVRYGSPIFDIMFFIYNSTSQKQREKDFEKLIKDYHTSASNMIRNLGSDPDQVFPYDDFKEELKKFSRFACGFCIESLPLSMLDDDEVTDLDSVIVENSTLLDFWKIKPIENIENRKRLADMFKHAVDNEFI